LQKKDPISVDDIIARRKLGSARKKNLATSGGNSRGTALADLQDDENDDADDDSEDEGQEQEAEEEFTSDEGDDGDSRSEQDGNDENNILDASSSSGDDEELETQAEKDRKAAFFDSSTLPSESHSSFLTMNLSRPILKAIAAMGFHKPTPIQEAAIPVALMGKDIVGGAVTGSGKTAAFMIPILERLVHRERGAKAAATRCLILVPTRELAVQSLEIGTKLGAHTDIRFCLIVGMYDPHCLPLFDYN
jgi:ATP-dependent RNA helicase DDX27